MIPVKQTILHDPDNGRFGNCFSAVLASLLHLPIDQVPIFYDPSDSNEAQWIGRVNDWLRPFGLGYVLIDAALSALMPEIKLSQVHHEIGGNTSRHAETMHSCVGFDGSVTFDPHPDATGLTQMRSLGLFVALQPWQWVHTSAGTEFFSGLRAIIVDANKPLGNRLQEVDARIAMVTGAEQPRTPYKEPARYTGEGLTMEQILANQADDLINLADAAGFVITIEQKPKSPLAMGSYDTVASVRSARGCT